MGLYDLLMTGELHDRELEYDVDHDVHNGVWELAIMCPVKEAIIATFNYMGKAEAIEDVMLLQNADIDITKA